MATDWVAKESHLQNSLIWFLIIPSGHDIKSTCSVNHVSCVKVISRLSNRPTMGPTPGERLQYMSFCVQLPLYCHKSTSPTSQEHHRALG